MRITPRITPSPPHLPKPTPRNIVSGGVRLGGGGGSISHLLTATHSGSSSKTKYGKGGAGPKHILPPRGTHPPKVNMGKRSGFVRVPVSMNAKPVGMGPRVPKIKSVLKAPRIHF